MNKIKEFFKEYGSIISKILINHIAMMIFGIIVLIAAKGINDVLFHIAGVVAILMYMFLLYMIMWELGSKDSVRVETQRMKRDNLLGLKISLVANAIFIVMAVVLLILSFFITEGESGINNVCGVIKIILHYFFGMYLSITYLAPSFYAIYLIVIIPAIVCCTLSYIAGVSGKKCLFPDKKKDKNQKR